MRFEPRSNQYLHEAADVDSCRAGTSKHSRDERANDAQPSYILSIHPRRMYAVADSKQKRYAFPKEETIMLFEPGVSAPYASVPPGSFGEGVALLLFAVAGDEPDPPCATCQLRRPILFPRSNRTLPAPRVSCVGQSSTLDPRI